jgi:hypothetical protein
MSAAGKQRLNKAAKRSHRPSPNGQADLHADVAAVEGCSGQLTQADGISVCPLRRPGTDPPREVSGRSSQLWPTRQPNPQPQATPWPVGRGWAGRLAGRMVSWPILLSVGRVGAEPTRSRGAVGPDRHSRATVCAWPVDRVRQFGDRNQRRQLMPIAPSRLAKSIGTLTDLHPDQDLAATLQQAGRPGGQAAVRRRRRWGHAGRHRRPAALGQRLR